VNTACPLANALRAFGSQREHDFLRLRFRQPCSAGCRARFPFDGRTEEAAPTAAGAEELRAGTGARAGREGHADGSCGAPNRPLQLTGPAPACGIQRFQGPALQVNVHAVGRTQRPALARRVAAEIAR
jgi:hypothetical protein